MKIYCIYGIGYDSNIYIITGKVPTIIDCGTGLNQKYVEDKIREIINSEEILQVILTHEHYDHCGGLKKIYGISNKNVKVFAHILASNKIEKGESDFARILGGIMPKMSVDIKLNNKETIQIGDEDFLVIHTPGHTSGCICLYSKQSKTLFSGDTVFAYGSFGRYDLPGGDAYALKDSIKKLSKFDIENLYPGHETIVEGNGNIHIKKSLENTSYII
ncbi:MAG: MBL fold metallo-hydrolase [Candidatus Thermoplasmatota archaeon]|nr:MBL fold metallo-hydrolase [Candidatus Thermoplasmatota archaeon]